eukprot:scaffold4809_cov116-Cylindrotheca_fusiformis.AAC.15
MAVTPVGPFCPFRSEAAEEMSPKMEQLQSGDAADFAEEFARIQTDLARGLDPNPEELRKAATGMENAVDQWEMLVTRLRISKDFQTREYAKLTQAHLETHNTSVENIRDMMRWQAGCLRALADNSPPPMPPPTLDMVALMQQAQDESIKPPPSIRGLQEAAESITAEPFDPKIAFSESPMIEDEYKRLVLDHSKLIDFGASYADFDPLGKLAFLDEIEKIQDRWDSFYFRFKLMGKLNEKYKKQCDYFLASMNMNEEDFRDLLKKTHQLMRKDAERERGL